MIKAIWAVLTGKVTSVDVLKLVDRTHFLTAYGKRKGGRVKAGVKPTVPSEGVVKDAQPSTVPPEQPTGDWDI